MSTQTDVAPWPVVGECHSSHIKGHTCPQCDYSHNHAWVIWRTPDWVLLQMRGPGLPVRCKVCGGRKCDRGNCISQRHHNGPHEEY